MSKTKKDSEEVVETTFDPSTQDIPAELGGSGGEGGYVPSTRTPGALVGGTTIDDLDEEDTRKPYLTVAHGVGKAADTFNPGDFVLDGQYLLSTKADKLELVILAVDQYQKEYLPYSEGGPMPRQFPSKQAAQDAGLRVAWVNGEGPEVRPAMDMIVLIRCPEDNTCPLFNIDLGDGHKYAAALFSRDKTAHQVLFEDIRHVAKGKLKSTGWHGGSWEFYTDLHHFKNGNKTWVSRARFVEMLDDKVYTAINDTLGGSSE